MLHVVLTKWLETSKSISKIRVRDLPTDRAIWCLGVHQEPINQKEFDKKLEDYSPKISCQPIKNTNYMFTLF